MKPEPPDKKEPAPTEPLVINDPGNEDPGSLMDDAQVPLREPEEDTPESVKPGH
ncbi:hypothetical protein M1B34_14585 [Pseudomonas sp. MAFF 302030]|uniref:Uncharacterized protein n=1 Tax=Pseudomonas morbosilactucae TaxID=2938197 RepID=A0A9X1YYM9_9PSED|nr:hypothetical protein [Pseudomonas morbosilactucae]MCK9798910.1 hypothetical protein [Pseudomonas morbosilactucae]MCK9814333.1 hypothetical protein [Pseudomonas morbosilactucae]WEK11464.1 MAG: hypothetical protein P0Y51_12285 [Pseudomonas sp.]